MSRATLIRNITIDDWYTAMEETNFLLFLESRGIQRQLKLHVSVLDSDNESFHSLENVYRRSRRSHRVNQTGHDDNLEPEQESQEINNEDQHEEHSQDYEYNTAQEISIEHEHEDNEDHDEYHNDSSSLEEDQQIFDFLSFERDNDDADTFYRDRRESFNNGIEYDDEVSSDEEFMQGDEIFNRYEYHSRSRTLPPRSNSSTNNLIANQLPQETIDYHRSSYEELEIHNEFTKEHIRLMGGLINPFNPAYTQIDPGSHYQLVKTSPSNKYLNSLKLEFKYNCKLSNHEFVRKYKNNLSTIITDLKSNSAYLVNASNSEILVYDFDPITNIPNSKPFAKFDTKPFFTTTSDRLLSTWPYFPHTVNYLKTAFWMDQQVLGVCVDDGNIMIYYVDSLISHINKYSTRDRDQNNGLFNIKINPDLKIKLESSAWGLDFLQYQDQYKNSKYVIITSDNSQSLTLFIYDKFDGIFYHVKSHQVLHNIPNVTFLNYRLDNDLHVIKASCCSISGELIIFKFKFQPVAGPLNKRHDYDLQEDLGHQEQTRLNGQSGLQRTYYVDSGMEQLELGTDANAFDMLKRYLFYQPRVVNRVLLREDCWTTIPIHKKYFSHQHSLNLVFGDPMVSHKAEISRVITESNIFNSLRHGDSNLGIAANWQYFESPVLNLNQDSYNHEFHPKLTTVDDDYRRINKQFSKFKQYESELKAESESQPDHLDENDNDLEENDHLIVVSTSKKVGLFNANSLFCNSSTPSIFNVNIPFNEESKFTNRISISHLIPELSCYIAVSQQGLISIFRLCQHRGIFGLRQEHLFPNAIALSLSPNGYRTIIGICTRNISPLVDIPRFLLYVSYSDGLLLTYELSNPANIMIDEYNL